jgi:hypothetical protein
LSQGAGASDRKLLLILCGVMVALIVCVSLLAPQGAADDPRPTTTNSSPNGAKAAYLMLEALGRKTSQWNYPLAELNKELNDAQAAHTTLILAAPEYDATEEKELAAEIMQFLERGGRVLATGSSGALLLPGGEVKAPGMLSGGLCHTTPEGPGPLARAGSVEMADSSQWASDGPQYRVEQRCGPDAVVVRYAVRGASGVEGDAVWWSSAAPLENAELKNDADLRLLLTTVGDGRDVVFDESLHGAAKTLWDVAKGLPLRWLALQAMLLFVLLIVSFSRRRGPVRSPALLPRSSPVEFATSMGDLYEKAAASSAATEAAKRRLLRVLTREAGVAQTTVDEGPEAIAEALHERLGGDWSRVSDHLSDARTAQHGAITMRSALALVRALSEDAKSVRARLEPRAVRHPGLQVESS